MTKIKICGITNINEVDILNKYKPDYAGFVFAKSRRQITAGQAASLGAKLIPAIKRVGVFVNTEAKQTADIAEIAGLDVVQLHGCEDNEYIKALRLLLKPEVEIWKALRIDTGHMPGYELLQSCGADRLLLDTYADGMQGGTGRCFDWELVSELDTVLPVVMAGGLNPDNVRMAIDRVSPFAVDTSSGVEIDGKKDEQKIQAFIEAVRGVNV